MAALSAATAIVAVVIPFAAGLSLLGTVPMGLLAYRFRFRVLIAATIAGGLIAFLVAGMGGMMTVVECAYVGRLIGLVKRKRRGTPTIIVVALVAGLAFGVITVVALSVLSRLRNLMFESMTANVNGLARFLSHLPYMDPVADFLKRGFATLLAYWPWVFGGASVLGIMIVTLIGWWALSHVITRLSGVTELQKLDAPAETGQIAPLPVRLHDVTFRYPTANQDALGPVTLTVEPGEHVAVTGVNGSGKTTLMLVLAGRPPTSGTVERAGAVGLGRVGGTAVIMQHPESQVLGSRVADDVVWGLPPGQSTDIYRLLRGGRAGRARRAGHRRPVRRRAAAAGGGRRACAGAVAADRRRGDEHGRPDRPGRAAWAARWAAGASPDGAGTHHPLQQRGRFGRAGGEPDRHRHHRQHRDGGGGRGADDARRSTLAPPRR